MCGYIKGVLRLIALGLVPAGKLSHLTIEHDPWCPAVGGAGSMPCRPEFFLDGVRMMFPEEADPEGRGRR